jgi:FKBP-type peptidyl-prolyl cis-trans isomerase FkpA
MRLTVPLSDEFNMRIFSTKAGLLFIFLVSLLLMQCGNNEHRNRMADPGKYKEPLIKANQEAVKEEKEQIDDFISRRKWKMEETSTGLRYMITRQGIGAKGQAGKTVKLSYTMTFLTGDTVYTALEDGPLIFVVGKGQVISGLEEAILLLKVGDRAKIIIPSHLAFGLIGDQKKILHKATLVYDLEFISMY